MNLAWKRRKNKKRKEKRITWEDQARTEGELMPGEGLGFLQIKPSPTKSPTVICLSIGYMMCLWLLLYQTQKTQMMNLTWNKQKEQQREERQNDHLRRSSKNGIRRADTWGRLRFSADPKECVVIAPSMELLSSPHLPQLLPCVVPPHRPPFSSSLRSDSNCRSSKQAVSLSWPGNCGEDK